MNSTIDWLRTYSSRYVQRAHGQLLSAARAPFSVTIQHAPARVEGEDQLEHEPASARIQMRYAVREARPMASTTTSSR